MNLIFFLHLWFDAFATWLLKKPRLAKVESTFEVVEVEGRL